MSPRRLSTIAFALAVSMCADEGMLANDAKADAFPDPDSFCDTNSCKKGPSLNDAPIISGEWKPFESPDLLVWGADVCLGYFLTKDESAWNGGIPNDELDEIFGISLVLGDFLARVRIYDWPYAVANSPYAGYGVFQCENTSWPARRLESVDKSEIEKWTQARLSRENGWVGSIDNWNSWRVASFRNDALGLTVEINNMSEFVKISFSADYFGPPIFMGGPSGLY